MLRPTTFDDEGTFEVGLFNPVSNPGIDDSALFLLLVIFNLKENLFFQIECDGRGDSSRFDTVKSGGENVVTFEENALTVLMMY